MTIDRAKTILIIEDDHELRVVLRQVFEAAAYLVLTATDGKNAFDLLKVMPEIDLIICDLKMPIMDGEAFIKIKNKESKIKDIPVLIISASTEKFCLFPGITCLPKPLDMIVLLKTAEDKIAKTSRP